MVATPAYHERGGLITVGPKGQVLHFAEHRQPSESGHINAGLYIFRPRVLSVLRPNERSFLERDLFPLLLRRRYRLFAYVMAGDYFDIGSREGYEQAQRALPRTEGNGG
jgi:NDP-sugar pyrophosphorylase family protein